MANTTLHDNEVLLRNANKTITNLREDNRRLSDELKNKTSLLSTCVEVAHEQSLRISSLTAALQDTWHWDPTTCPRPSLCSTPVRPPPWTEVACGRGKPVAASLPSRCLELSNRYDPLLHMGLDADPSPSLAAASPALASGVSTASRSGGRSRKHSSTASPAPASRSAGCLAPSPPASRAGGPNRKHGSAAASSAPASCVPTAARSGDCPALSPRATYGVRSCSTAGPEQQRPRQVATSATRRRLLREAVLRRSGNLHHPNCTPGSPPMAASATLPPTNPLHRSSPPPPFPPNYPDSGRFNNKKHPFLQCHYKMFSRSHNIKNYGYAPKPTPITPSSVERAVLHVGTNDVAHGNSEQVKEHFNDLFSMLKDQEKTSSLVALYPVPTRKRTLQQTPFSPLLAPGSLQDSRFYLHR
ncbi:hypothetical protein D5F01_LYC04707 [Larimichthys crocea]|uniref:Uncharacterized protein n=1 Tax=Larimichthys crocea TaxID=215358 RepID=A0A6G0IWY8_LARCR|nr:hypothetical protein D5F01_LYC04707 [Larimichthys crocea]